MHEKRETNQSDWSCDITLGISQHAYGSSQEIRCQELFLGKGSPLGIIPDSEHVASLLSEQL